MQIPLSFAVPWNFTKEEIFQAESWVQEQARLHPEDERIQAALHVISDIANEYRVQSGMMVPLPQEG